MELKEAHKYWLSLGLIILIGFILRLVLFLKIPYVAGVDGGYYAYLTQELLQTGTYSDSLLTCNPIIFYISAFFGLFFGANTGVAIATSLFSALLGLSVFILMQYLFKNHKASLFSAFLVVFSPLSLRMMADIRKNVLGLFFVPLIFYFILKSFQDKRYLIGVFITAGLGVFSHQSVIVVGFIMIAYIALYFAFNKKVEKSDIISLLIISIPAIIATIFLSSYVIEGLEWVAASPGIFFKTSFGGLDYYIIPLIIAAIPGFFICLKRRTKNDIFLLSWVIMSFLLTLPGICGGSGYWRFILLFYVPLAFVAGISFTWLYEKSKELSYILIVILILVVTAQFFYFGLNDSQMQPKLSQEVLSTIEKSADFIIEDAIIYSTAERHDNYWVRFFYETPIISMINDAEFYYINQNLSDSYEVFIFDMNSQGPMMNKFNLEDNTNLKEVFGQGQITLYRVLDKFENAPTLEQIERMEEHQEYNEETEEYDNERLYYLSSYLILPYEIVYLINPPNVELYLVLIAFPLSILIIGLILFFLINKIESIDSTLGYSVIGVSIILMTLLYLLQPSFFWGPSAEEMMHDQMQGDMMQPGNNMMDPDMQNNQDMMHDQMQQQQGMQDMQHQGQDRQQQPQERMPSSSTMTQPCGDGVCDQYEEQDSTLCPEDCD